MAAALNEPKMRTPKEVMGLARRGGAERVEIRFVDAVGVSRQFMCPVGEMPDTVEKQFDGSGDALTRSFRAATSRLNSRITSPRFACRGLASESASLVSKIGASTGGFEECDQRTTGAESGTNSSAGGMNLILLIEQDPVFRKFIRTQLENRGFKVLDVASVQEGVEAASHSHPGAALVDLDVPDTNGLNFIKELRRHRQLPILALSGQTGGIGAVETLDVGANDFITRPVNFDELSARLRVAQRQPVSSSSDIFRSGSLTVDLARRLVSVAGKLVNLSVTEYSLLHLLIRNACAVVSYAEMLREVWGAEMLDKVNYLRVYLVVLRKKLEVPSEPGLLLTERSVGYRLVIR